MDDFPQATSKTAPAASAKLAARERAMERNAALAARIAQVKPVPATVQLLEKQLVNGDAEVREQGVESITKIRPPAEPLTDMLARLIQHENWYVRRSAAAALSKCAELEGAAEMAHKVAAAQMENEDPDVRLCVARAMLAVQLASVSRRPPHSSGLGIQRRVFQNPEEVEAPGDEDAPPTARSVDSMAGKASAGCVAPDYGELAVLETAQRLAHEDSQIRELAVTTLSQMGPAAAPYGKKLGQLLADTEVNVVVAAVCAFEQLGIHAASGIEEAVKVLSHHQELYRRQAHKTLIVASKTAGEDVVTHVIKALTDLQPRRKEERERQSGRRTPPGSKGSSDEAPVKVVMRAMLTLLCDLGKQEDLGAEVAIHMKVLVPCMEDPDVEIRACAIRCLIAAGPEVVSGNGLKYLRKRMESKDVMVSRAAVEVLKGLAPHNPIIAGSIGQVLWEEAQDLQPETMRQRSLVLVVLGGAQANAKKFLEHMAREMEAPDFKVRRAAMEAFVDLKEHALPASAEIAKRLIHAEPLVRRLAVECVQLMGPYGVKLLPRVKGLLDTEEDRDVIHAVKRALEGKSGVASEVLSKPRRASIAARRASLKSQRRGGVDTGHA
ncbi:unnamed protein product [Effrenium voratum]|nr:unnamed protein product [Effrenium voratum]